MDEINPKLLEVYRLERSGYVILRNLLTSINELQARWRPAADRWSIGELAHHLSLAQARILGAIELVLQEAEQRNLGPDPDTQSAAHSLDFAYEMTRGRLHAGPRVTPQRDRDLAPTLGEIDSQQAGLEAILPRLSRRDLRQLRFPHVLLGELDVYQWILFWGGHASRHRKQMEAVIQDASYPR